MVITNRSLVLGQTVHDKVLESPLINLVSNSVNNARFWYFDVPESIVSSAPIEIYVSGMTLAQLHCVTFTTHLPTTHSNRPIDSAIDTSSTAMVPARLTAVNSYCPMLLETPLDFRETFLEFTTQGLLSLTRFGPELTSGRWYDYSLSSLSSLSLSLSLMIA